MRIPVKNLKHLINEMTKDIAKIGAKVLDGLGTHINETVVDDYRTRVQANYYPLRNPITKDVIDSIPPIEISKSILMMSMADRVINYIQPGTEVEKSARLQELFGGKTWQMIRTNMQNFEYVNRILTNLGMGSITAKVKV